MHGTLREPVGGAASRGGGAVAPRESVVLTKPRGAMLLRNRNNRHTAPGIAYPPPPFRK